MPPLEPDFASIDHKVIQLFALVSEALSKATHALLNDEPLLGQIGDRRGPGMSTPSPPRSSYSFGMSCRNGRSKVKSCATWSACS